MHAPTHNFEDKFIQDINNLDKDIGHIIINSFIDTNTGYIIISSHKKYESLLNEFLEGLCDKNLNIQELLLTNFIFKSSENNYWNISWWDLLDSDRKQELDNYIHIPSGVTKLSEIKVKTGQPAFSIIKSYYLPRPV